MKSKSCNLKSELISAAYVKYITEVKNYFSACLHSETEAEDLTQDLFIKLMDYSGMIVESTVKSFIFTMAHRMVIDIERHNTFVRKSTNEYKYISLNDIPYYEEKKLECEQLEKAEMRIIDKMPTKMANIYIMSRFEHRSIDEMALMLDISRRTVESHLYLSRQQVRNTLRRIING
jgi:RNA polymerase sigma factor (sigma-70 family)